MQICAACGQKNPDGFRLCGMFCLESIAATPYLRRCEALLTASG